MLTDCAHSYRSLTPALRTPRHIRTFARAERTNVSRLKSMIALALAVGASQQLAAQPSRGALSRGTLAFTNVNVVPMNADTVIRDVTVVVRDGRIAAIGRR